MADADHSTHPLAPAIDELTALGTKPQFYTVSVGANVAVDSQLL